ncbi:hypothetical protein [Maliponia aquimaris]|uniref:Lipoprotein n=1 Tax=Maliponia aquimaris TaxID=1673631 RepID=A0A238JQP2_9RHOB|nr:hypothetical protein [Maliponia aquimaris]SMX32875.1 hypothetical protein MAA8898_00349 [Maliponia aquimaris]
MRIVSLVFCGLLIALTGQAQAGTWKRLWPQDPDDCGYLFTGTIEKGDLVDFFNSGDLKGVNRICLHSPGGSLNEAFQFLKLVRGEDSFGTRVRSGDSCVSACALVFMFGQRWGANSPYPSRELEPGAQLGFHTPFPNLDKDAQGNLAAAFDVALKVSRLLVNSSYTAFSSKGPSIPPEIVAVMLETPADKMTYIDTVGELQLLGIDTTRRPEDGFAMRNDYVEARNVVRRVCASTYVTRFRQHSVSDGYKYSELLQEVDALNKQHGKDDLLHLKVLTDKGVTSVFGVTTGGYHYPGLFSNAALLYCRAEFHVTEKDKTFTVSSYRVDFGPMRPEVKQRLPTVDETTIHTEAFGLIPMDRKY